MNRRNKKTQVKVVVQNPTTKKNNRRRRRRSVKPSSKLIRDYPQVQQRALLTTNFENYITAPDIFGPFRIPRWGGSDKTGVWIAKGRTSLVGHTTNVVQGIFCHMHPSQNFDTTAASRNFMATAVATSETAALDTTQLENNETLFPAPNGFRQVSYNGISIKATYIGSVLEAAGEVLLVAIPHGSDQLATIDLSSYSSLYALPGSVTVPVADSIKNPARVYGFALSPSGNQFFDADDNQDRGNWMVPTILCSGLPEGQQLRLEWTWVGEYTSDIVAGDVIPYEKTTASFTEDASAYQDATANLSERATNATLSESWLGPFFDSFGEMSLTDSLGTGLRNLDYSQLARLMGNAALGDAPSIPDLMGVAMPAIHALMGRR